MATTSSDVDGRVDPASRLGGATDTVNGTTTRSVVNHYADPSDAPAWITTTTGGQSGWIRNVAGLTGDLAATEDNTGTVTLQLANLHGDIVATAADDPAATGTTGYVEATEYGTPRPANTTTVTPDRYGWLGAKQRSTDDLAGLVLMGVRLYNPGTGRFLQPDPVPGGSAGPYLYPTNPIDGYDLNGQCWWGWHCWKKKLHAVVSHAGDISAVAGAISLLPIPGVDVVAGAVSVGFGAVAAYQDRHHPLLMAADIAGTVGGGAAIRWARTAARWSRIAEDVRLGPPAEWIAEEARTLARRARVFSVASFGLGAAGSAWTHRHRWGD